MSLPREVVPGRTYFLTRRCTQRQFLLRPDDETNNVFEYCLAEAAKRFNVGVIFTCTMSNHHHTIIYDRLGNYPAFLEHFHKMVARCMNRLRDREENFWSTEQPSVVRLLERGDVLAKIVYAATNPVNAHLVERVHQWPGVNTFDLLRTGRTRTIRRPRHYFTNVGLMPESVELEIELPPEFGSAQDMARDVVLMVGEVERQMSVERMRTNRRVLGVRNVLRQNWTHSPSTPASNGGISPRVAGLNKWARIEALQHNAVFLDAYRQARRQWREKKPFAFPVGTYWMRRVAHVPVETDRSRPQPQEPLDRPS